MAFVSSLTLNSFRSYQSVALRDIPSGLVVLHGVNGAGKTNILEALCPLLAPGRGFARGEE